MKRHKSMTKEPKNKWREVPLTIHNRKAGTWNHTEISKGWLRQAELWKHPCIDTQSHNCRKSALKIAMNSLPVSVTVSRSSLGDLDFYECLPSNH